MNRPPNSAFVSTSLHRAADSGDLELCRRLVGEGADINALDECGWSPLIRAVQQDHLAIARLLLQQGAPLQYSYQRQDNPEARARQQRWWEQIQQMPAYLAAQQELRMKLPPELQDVVDEFPGLTESMVDLHFMPGAEQAIGSATSIGMFELLVLEFGANIDCIDGEGYWPLSRAAEAGDLALVRWLLDHGADPNRTSTGATAIFNAISQDRLEIVQLLTTRGAALQVTDVDGWSPLFACRCLEMAKHLLQHGADPTVTDQAGFPCWHWVDDAPTREFLKASALERGLVKWTDEVHRASG